MVRRSSRPLKPSWKITSAHRFGDVRVGFDLRNLRLTSSDRTPPEDWDGVHVWLHYQSELELYYASFDRRDGRIVVKKKCAGGSTNGGTYYELRPGEVPGYPIRFGRWKHVSAAPRSPPREPSGSVATTTSSGSTTSRSRPAGSIARHTAARE
jgi:hypothetical protein